MKTGRLASDPAAELELPKIPRRLPPVILSAPEAEAVLRQPDLGTREGLRDRAILELLYSTGMRRAEAAALLLVDFDPTRGLVRVRQGKGGKDRYVPTGEPAIRWVEKYLGEARPRFVRGTDGGALFHPDLHPCRHQEAAGGPCPHSPGPDGARLEPGAAAEVTPSFLLAACRPQRSQSGGQELPLPCHHFRGPVAAGYLSIQETTCPHWSTP